jgi:ligand-binding sensor domain-containing protein
LTAGGPSPIGPVFAVTVDRNGTIWTGGSARLRRIDETGTTVFVLSQVRDYRSLAIGKANFEPHPQANTNIPGYAVCDLMTDENGKIWVATDNGISIIDGTGKLLSHFDTDDGLPGNEVLCMTHDRAGTLWIGTDNGPASYRDGQWTTYPKCPAGITLAVTTGSAGNVYFGTYRHGIISYDGKSYRRYDSLNSRLPHNMVTALAYDAQNGLWAGTAQGLLRINKDSQQLYTKENSALLSNKITDLLADGPNIWIATDAGVAKYDQ